MKEYLEEILHRQIELSEFQQKDKLPLVYRNSVQIYVLHVDGQECLLIEPKESMTLPEMRKCQKQVSRYTGMFCAFYLKTMSYYAKDTFIQEGIPFVWENHQLYLPFMGMMLNAQDGRKLRPCTQISFITQKLLLQALYDNWQGKTVSQAAEALAVSKMTITRCYDEIEVLELPILQVKSRARKLFSETDKKAMWELVRPVLRSPILRTFRLKNQVKEEFWRSGISALAEYSMLEDNDYPTFAFAKAQLKDIDTKGWEEVPIAEQPSCEVQELGYLLPYRNQKLVDPLSVALMLTEEEQSDPRVEIAIKEMLEEYVW